MPSVPSSMDDRCECGHTRFRHPDGHCVAICNCGRYRAVKVEDVSLPGDKPCDCGHQVRHLESECAAAGPPFNGGRTPEQQAILDACQHPNKEYTGSVSGAGVPTQFRFRCPDCKERITVTEEPPEARPYVWHGDGSRCEDTATCGRFHAQEQPVQRAEEPEAGFTEYEVDAEIHDWYHPEATSGLVCRACGLAHKHWSGEGCPGPKEPEPPMTPEEEEEAPEDDKCTCGRTACESELCDCDSAPCPVDHAAEAAQTALDVRSAPPQPERRPPYAVAYSAAGHLYEVLLPGDATAHAVDGSLVIEHPGSPVLGIVRVLPVPKKEAS